MASGSRRRGRIFIYIGLIIILGLALAWLVLRNQPGISFGAKPPATPAAAEETVGIVVTTQQVQKGTEFTEAELATIPYPKKNLGEGTFYTNISDVIGKKAKIDLDPKIPVTSSLVVDKADGSLAAFQIPKGMVAVSVPIDRLSSVSYAPQPGDHVNVIVTLLLKDLDTNFQTELPNLTAGVITPGPAALTTGTSTDGSTTGATTVSKIDVTQNLMAQIISGGPGSTVGRAEIDTGLGQPLYVLPSEPQRARMVSQSLLQDAMVLQVGNFALPTDQLAAAQPVATQAPDANGQTQPVATTPKAPDVITLVVTPQDAITLNFLMFNDAKLSLALRGAGDDQRIQTEAVTLQYLMDQYNIPVPAKLPYGLEPRENSLTTPKLINDQPTATPK